MKRNSRFEGIHTFRWLELRTSLFTYDYTFQVAYIHVVRINVITGFIPA